jgi:hypothetical protein
MKETRSSETSVLIGPTRRHISEDGILPTHRHETLKYYLYQVLIEIMDV